MDTMFCSSCRQQIPFEKDDVLFVIRHIANCPLKRQNNRNVRHE